MMRSLDINQFHLENTLECGQTFCWNKYGEGYVNTDIGKAVYVEQKGNRLLYETSSGDINLQELLRLNDPLPMIQAEISKDDLLRKSIDFAPGLRIVSDPFFPCLISFLCSTRNSIPSIQRATQAIRKKYGSPIKLKGKMHYQFPTIKQLSAATVENLKSLGLDWRAEYVTRTTASILNGEVDPEELRKMSYEEAHAKLTTLFGVGDKVADCVCLFSLGFLDAFPIDVWIERVIQKYYGIFTATGKSYAKKSRAARDYFGQYAGYAQEYLYNYSRKTFPRR